MIEIFPLRIETKKRVFSLIKVIESTNFVFDEGDILVISSKLVSMSEGSLIDLSTVKASVEAKKLASQYHMDPRFAEIVIRES
ncbi:MAG TPA: coenzyme F420-0:L-glutamate ligase, partial [Nitrososphaeraceae archaeon]